MSQEWRPTEQAAMDALKHIGNDVVPMKMLFPDLKFSRGPWDARFDAVFETQEHWRLFSDYATGRRWSTMEDEDAALFDFWLLDWFDYEGWIKGAKRPDDIASEMKGTKSKRKKHKMGVKNENSRLSDSPEVLDQVFRDFISSSHTSVSLADRNAWERKWFHIRAEQARLQSNSDGCVPNSKTITLTKPDGWTLPKTPKTTSREQQEEQQETWRMTELEREDARFQIYCKYEAWGYDCPDDMIEGEPGLAESAEIW